jgi:hypothetical protein
MARVAIVGLVLALPAGWPRGGYADGWAGGGVQGGDPTVGVGDGGRAGSGESGGTGVGSGIRCEYTPLPVGTDVGIGIPGIGAVVSEPGWLEKLCFDAAGRLLGPPEFIPPRDAAAVARDLAREALAKLPLGPPTIGTSPPPEREQLVNLPTWLWISAAEWTNPRTATASVPGISATVTAKPQWVRWSMGNRDTLVCAGPGATWDPARAGSEQSTDCSYTYRHSSAAQPGERFTITATVEYAVTWQATGAPGGGSLGTLSRTAGASLRVGESQAIGVAG